MNTKELGSPSVIEDEDNIKKAQTLSKDLEDVSSASHYFLFVLVFYFWFSMSIFSNNS